MPLSEDEVARADILKRLARIAGGGDVRKNRNEWWGEDPVAGAINKGLQSIGVLDAPPEVVDLTPEARAAHDKAVRDGRIKTGRSVRRRNP